jgi:hypothetical protein
LSDPRIRPSSKHPRRVNHAQPSAAMEFFNSLLVLDFLVAGESVDRQELTDWAAELHTLSAEGKYFFSTTRCFFGVTKPVLADPELEQVEDVRAPL